MIECFQALDQRLLRDQVVAAGRDQCIQFQAIVRLGFRLRLGPGLQVLARLGVVTEANQQINQLQAQVVVIRVGRQQQLGVIGRHCVRLAPIRLEDFFALERGPQQAAHGDRDHRQCPRIEQAAIFSCRGADHYSPAS